MKHFVCTGGCEGRSDTAGVCQAETCPKFGQPLTECDCTGETCHHHEEAKQG